MKKILINVKHVVKNLDTGSVGIITKHVFMRIKNDIDVIFATCSSKVRRDSKTILQDTKQFQTDLFQKSPPFINSSKNVDINLNNAKMKKSLATLFNWLFNLKIHFKLSAFFESLSLRHAPGGRRNFRLSWKLYQYDQRSLLIQVFLD